MLGVVWVLVVSSVVLSRSIGNLGMVGFLVIGLEVVVGGYV